MSMNIEWSEDCKVQNSKGEMLAAILNIEKSIIPNGTRGFIKTIFIKSITVHGKRSTLRYFNIFTMADGSTYEIV